MMKSRKYWFLLAGLLLYAAGVRANNLMYFAELAQFFEPGGKPYVELYLNVDGRTATYASTGQGTFAALVDVNLEVKSENGDQVYARHFELQSPEALDTMISSRESFLDIRRISLEPGRYTLTGTVQDKHDPSSKPQMFEISFQVDPQPAELCYSDLILIQSFRSSTETLPHTKHGYEVIPQVSNASCVNQDSLKYYLEIYHADAATQGVYYVSTYLTQANSTEKLASYSLTAKKTARPFDILVGGFDISLLPSQTYVLNLDFFSRENKLLGTVQKKVFVYNSRVELVQYESGPLEQDFFAKLTDAELDAYIPTLLYISTPTEISFAKSLRTHEEKVNYFKSFWEKRRKKPEDHPAKAWKQYEATVKYANQHYKSVRMPGWKTDRGRILLTEGAPNEIERYPSDDVRFPYEVWRYNKINTQSDVIFVFYDPDMATNDYPLLHTTRLGGPANPRWQVELMRRTNWDGNLDHDTPGGQNR